MKTLLRFASKWRSILFFTGWLLEVLSISLASVAPVQAAPGQQTPAEEVLFQPGAGNYTLKRAITLTAFYHGPEGVISRTEAPEELPDSEAQAPSFVTFELDNGLTVVVVEQQMAAVVRASLYVGGGNSALPLEGQGIAELLAAMVTKDTTSRTAEEIAGVLKRIGGVINASVTSEQMNITAMGPSLQRETLFDVMADVVLHPAFPADEFAVMQKQLLAEMTVDEHDPAILATRQFRRIVYGDHLYSYYSTPARIATFTADDLASFHESYFKPNNALLVITGDLDVEEARAQAEHSFGEWKAADIPDSARALEVNGAENMVIYLVDQPDTDEATIRVGNLAVRGTAEDRFALIVANHILGGRSLNSRLGLNLRVDKGYTVGVRSNVEMQRETGLFVVEGSFGQEVAGVSVREILAEIKRLQSEPLATQELNNAKSFLVAYYLADTNVPATFANRLASNFELGLPWASIDTYVSRLEAVTAAEVRAAAQHYMETEHPIIVVVGNAEVIQPQLQELGDVIVVDARGEALE